MVHEQSRRCNLASSKQHLAHRGGNNGCAVENARRPLAIATELHVVVQHDIRKKRLQLGRSKEPSRAARRVSTHGSFNVRVSETSNAPCMPAVAEGDVIERGVDELVLRPLALAFAHLREAEWVKRARVRVVRLVVMYGVRSRNHKRALRKERAVTQRYVSHHLACERH